MNKPFDPTKPVQTRDGKKARIICSDLKGRDCSIVGLYTIKSGKEQVRYYQEDGTAPGDIFPNLDLVNVPERKIRYVNLETQQTMNNNSVKSIDAVSRSKDYKCASYSTVKLTFEDGKLVDSEVIR